MCRDTPIITIKHMRQGFNFTCVFQIIVLLHDPVGIGSLTDTMTFSWTFPFSSARTSLNTPNYTTHRGFSAGMLSFLMWDISLYTLTL